MSSHQSHLSQSIAALQVLVFEMNWPTFKWIGSIHFIFAKNVLTLHIECQQKPEKTEIMACSKMLEEIYIAAFSTNTASPPKLAITYSGDHPMGEQWKKLIDDHIFRQIAKEVAPWRLDAGR